MKSWCISPMIRFMDDELMREAVIQKASKGRDDFDKVIYCLYYSPQPVSTAEIVELTGVMKGTVRSVLSYFKNLISSSSRSSGRGLEYTIVMELKYRTDFIEVYEDERKKFVEMRKLKKNQNRI